MTLPPDMIAQAALLSGATLLGFALNGLWARFALSGVTKARPVKPSLPAAVARQQAMPKKRRVAPYAVAHYVLDNLRFDDSEDHPVLPGDLDDFIDRWCDENEVERVPKSTVREIIALAPEVTKIRVRLNMDNPAHRWVRERQKIRGEPLNDRPVVYIMANQTATEPACPASDRPVANPCPTPDRSDRTRVRTVDAHVAGRVSERERRVA